MKESTAFDMIHMNGIKIEYRAVQRAKELPTSDGLRELLCARAAQLLRVQREELLQLEILRESVDARKKPDIMLQYAVAVKLQREDAILHRLMRKQGDAKGKRTSDAERSAGEQKTVVKGVEIAPYRNEGYRFPQSGEIKLWYPVLIAGAGPAGLFCGYYLALHGYRPVILERGKAVEERQKDVELFWETGVLLPDSNVQFGEGGAGAFSDGKLNTLVKDKDGRNREVLRLFVECGAGEEILYEAKPHIGTDVLCRVVRRMRDQILANGGEIRFESQVTDVKIADGKLCGVIVNGAQELPCEQLVLAVGHSARDTFRMLCDRQVPMEAKSFAVGLRVEHEQAMINQSQYGFADPGTLGAAPYKVTAKAENGRGVYSFCMCPGGYVVNASSEEGHLAVNGMSYSGRNGANANSAVIVSVTPKDYGSDHPLAGVEFQRMLEKRAYELAGGRIPMQRYGVFRECVEQGKTQEELGITSGEHEIALQEEKGAETLVAAHKGQSAWADVSRILPKECNEAFVQGMTVFGRQIKGFDNAEVILSGVESRTSSPVRITRDESLQSAIRGLYPCGEGAGYAGGITSAAMDGMRVAEAIASEYAPLEQHENKV